MKLTWFGHSAFRLDFDGAVVILDPFLSGNPLFKGDVGEATKGATHILLTHGHDDHVGDALAIAKATGAQLVSNFEICMWLNAQGVEAINPGNTGGTVDCGPFTTTFTQALHSSGTTRDGASVYLGNPNGLIVKPKSGPSVYHMGDTDIFGDMALIEELHAPRIGLVPIGDRFTMGGATAALACRRYFSFDLVLPCHYRTFGVLDQTADIFAKGLSGTRTKIATPEPGGSVTA